MKNDRGKLLTGLISRSGDFQTAEDALQEALIYALGHWGRAGIPAAPHSWLMKAAYNEGIDRVRKNAREIRKVNEYGDLVTKLVNAFDRSGTLFSREQSNERFVTYQCKKIAITVSPEFMLLGLNGTILTLAYFLIYPRMVGAGISKLMQSDLLATTTSVIVAGFLFWGTNQPFDLLFGEVNWFALSVVTFLLMEVPFALWYLKKFDAQI